MSAVLPSRQDAAVARLVLSRQRLHGALQQRSGAGTAGALLGHLVQTHPWLAAALAMAAGGLLSRLRPWRWVLKSDLWKALLPPVMAGLATAPLGAWAGVLLALLRQASAVAAAAAAPTAPMADTAPSPHTAPMPSAAPMPSKNA